MGSVLASINASLADLAPRRRDGIVCGVDATPVSIANVLSPMAGGSPAAAVGLRTPFVGAAVVFDLEGLVAMRPAPRTLPRAS